MIVLLAGFVSAKPGAIWTTTESCGEDPQNENHYFAGQTVYINGANFKKGTYEWNIAGQPFKEKDIIISGKVIVDSTEKFCFPAYTIQYSDSGEYKATVGNKHDNYRVISPPMVPEFGLVAGIITIFGALGTFLIIRKK